MVRRYGPLLERNDEHGCYVHHDDYLRLQAKLEEKERECERLLKRLSEEESILKKIATDPAYYCSLGTHEAKEYMEKWK